MEFFEGKKVSKIVCNFAQTAAITEGNQLYIWGWRGAEPVFVPELVHSLSSKTVLKVALGGYHVLALVEVGGHSVYAWGKNDKGQLGIAGASTLSEPTLLSFFDNLNIFDIDAGEISSAAITSRILL